MYEQVLRKYTLFLLILRNNLLIIACLELQVLKELLPKCNFPKVISKQKMKN